MISLKILCFLIHSFVFLLATTATFSITAQSSLPIEAVQKATTYFKSIPKPYMEKNCVEAAYQNWENLPLKDCSYSVKGKNEQKSKTAKVIMLNAPPEQLARWVVSTCLEIFSTADTPCTDWIIRRIMNQSGTQFPVAGIVFEDLNEDGIHEIYVFRDGVTVRVNGITNGDTRQPTDQQIKDALNGKVVSTGKFARIQGTTRAEYKSNTLITKEKYPNIFKNVYDGKIYDVGDDTNRQLIWLDVVRDLYKAAWGEDRNELMISWARANAGQIKGAVKPANGAQSFNERLIFDFPAPTNLSNKKDLWATYYYGYDASNLVSGGHPLLDMSGDKIGASLSALDWCLGGIEGTIRVTFSKELSKVYNYAGRGSSKQVDCSPYVKNSKIDLAALGKVRYSVAKGSFGDGVQGMILIPYRSIAVDKDFIPYGTVLYIPQARGVNILLPSGQTVKHDGYFYAADTGGAIKTNHIDVFAGVIKQNPFPGFVKSTETKTFEAFVITDSKIIEKLKTRHKL